MKTITINTGNQKIDGVLTVTKEGKFSNGAWFKTDRHINTNDNTFVGCLIDAIILLPSGKIRVTYLAGKNWVTKKIAPNQFQIN